MTVVRSTARIANDAWEALFRAQATIAAELTAQTDWADLQPREYGVLYALSTAPNGLRITELGEDVLLSQPGMSRLIARLEARGLVRRDDDPDDARACRVRLTSAGAELQRTVGLSHGRLRRAGDDPPPGPPAAPGVGRPLPPAHRRASSKPIPARAAGTVERWRRRDDRVPTNAMTATAWPPRPRRDGVIVISAGTGEPSSTRMLADRIAQKTRRAAPRNGHPTPPSA